MKINNLIKIKNPIPVFVFTLIIFLFSCNQTVNKNTDVATEPDWSNKVIYEVNIRQYTPEGTIKAFEEHLPRLKEMGVDILWLMPIFPIGEVHRKATQTLLVEEIENPEERKKYLGSYYSIKDYKAINPEFGTMEDFKSLVKKIHELGMYVIVDIAINHTAQDHDWFNSHPDFYSKVEAGSSPWNPDWIKQHPDFFAMLSKTGYTYPIDTGETDWWDTADLDYSNEDLRKEMKEILKFWIETCNIDGYRCDVAGMVPTDFWESASTELEIKPLFMLAEWESEELLNNAFDMDYNWHLMHVMNMIAKGEMNASYIDTVLAAKSKYNEDDINMNFTTNHDENTRNGTVFERYADGVKTFTALSFTLPGMPLIYSGQEAGLNKRLKFFEKDTIDWSNLIFEDFYKKLNALKHSNDALKAGSDKGNFIKVNSSINNEVYSFIRENGNNKVWVILNLGNNTLYETIESNVIKGNYTELFTNEKITTIDRIDIKLKPWEYKIFVQ